MKIFQFSQRVVFFFLLFLAIVVFLAPSMTAVRAGNSANSLIEPGIRITHSDDTGLSFQLHTEKFRLDKDGNIQVTSLQQSMLEAGSPALPYYSTYIAVPPHASVAVEVSKSGLAQYPAIEVLPVPYQQLHTEPDQTGMLVADPQTISELAPVFRKDSSIYAIDAPFPQVDYEVSESMYLRDLRLVELKLFPIRYNPYRKTVLQAADLSVQITFSGADLSGLKPSTGYVDKQADSLREMVLNFDQSCAWRSLPEPENSSERIADLPIGADTFKIIVDQDGLYEISANELKNAGMALPVDPQTIEMMHRGLPVSYQFIDGNSNGQFDEGDKVRFYGWAFDGSRYEQMFVNDNIFWLWAGGNASVVPVEENDSGSGNIVTTFVDTITRQDENDNFSGWGVIWENEPTIWQWDLIHVPTGTTGTRSYDLELPDPDPSAPSNLVTVELTTRSADPTFSPNHTVKTTVNDYPKSDEDSWTGRYNLNVVTSVPGIGLKQPGDAAYPSNQINIELSSDSPAIVSIYLTRITVEYTRMLNAVNDQLIFSSSTAGHHDFLITGFTSGNSNNAIVWDISNRRSPQEINLQGQDIKDDGGTYSYVVGRSHGTDGQFIATTTSNIRTVKDISRYKPVSLNPPSGKAQWIAISHSSLRSAADKLAEHRAKEYSTWVVNIEDVVNQVGSGFNTPQTIRNYLFHALVNWEEAPEYVTLFGDATRNPLGQDCPLCGAWDKDAKTLLVTDFAFVDRWNGMIPTDYTMSTLVGNDLLPDTTIGRLPAGSLTEANNMVQKVILYENQRPDNLQPWQRNFLFVADDPDTGGNFCKENVQTGYKIPRGPYNQTHLCLPKPTVEDTEALRLELSKQVNDIGLSVLNFRGHGSATAWAGSQGSPKLLTNEDADFWQNVGRPVVILSADCLDGYFIFTHTTALGESFLGLNNRGSAAHWSSSGLGFSSEHSVLHSNYFEGVFKYRYREMGFAVNHAKVKYYQAGQYPSELYSFILLGDPALKVVPIVESGAFFPFIKARF